MPTKLLKTKWYIVNLSTKTVAIDRTYDRFWDAVDGEKKNHNRFPRFTALTGRHILKYAGRPWIIPASF